MVNKGDEDISPYATFHLLGMREENKNGGPNPQNFKTLQPNQSMGPSMAGTMAGTMAGPPPGMVQQAGPQTGPNTPAHQRHMSQTMNVSFPKSYYKPSINNTTQCSSRESFAYSC